MNDSNNRSCKIQVFYLLDDATLCSFRLQLKKHYNKALYDQITYLLDQMICT